MCIHAAEADAVSSPLSSKVLPVRTSIRSRAAAMFHAVRNLMRSIAAAEITITTASKQLSWPDHAVRMTIRYFSLPVLSLLTTSVEMTSFHSTAFPMPQSVRRTLISLHIQGQSSHIYMSPIPGIWFQATVRPHSASGGSDFRISHFVPYPDRSASVASAKP